MLVEKSKHTKPKVNHQTATSPSIGTTISRDSSETANVVSRLRATCLEKRKDTDQVSLVGKVFSMLWLLVLPCMALWKQLDVTVTRV